MYGKDSWLSTIPTAAVYAGKDHRTQIIGRIIGRIIASQLSQEARTCNFLPIDAIKLSMSAKVSARQELGIALVAQCIVTLRSISQYYT
jgi:hypothetical protein